LILTDAGWAAVAGDLDRARARQLLLLGARDAGADAVAVVAHALGAFVKKPALVGAVLRPLVNTEEHRCWHRGQRSHCRGETDMYAPSMGDIEIEAPAHVGSTVLSSAPSRCSRAEGRSGGSSAPGLRGTDSSGRGSPSTCLRSGRWLRWASGTACVRAARAPRGRDRCLLRCRWRSICPATSRGGYRARVDSAPPGTAPRPGGRCTGCTRPLPTSRPPRGERRPETRSSTALALGRSDAPRPLRK
jgi:hypothetical protein